MAHIKLHKSQNAFDTASYLRLAYNVNRTLKPKTVKQQSIDPKALQPCIAFLPLDTIKRTLECTTQLAKGHTRVPLQRHWKPCFLHLNVHQLMEPVATDTFLANCNALGGDTCGLLRYPKSHDKCLPYQNRKLRPNPHHQLNPPPTVSPVGLQARLDSLLLWQQALLSNVEHHCLGRHRPTYVLPFWINLRDPVCYGWWCKEHSCFLCMGYPS